MEHKYIDKFFKNKLEQRDVAFSEEAWLAAEKMIEADEQKRRWGGLGRLWFFLPFLIAGIIIYVYQTQSVNIPFQQNNISGIPFSIPSLDKTFPKTTKAVESKHIKSETNNQNISIPSDQEKSPQAEVSAVVAGTAKVETTKPSLFTQKKPIPNIDKKETPAERTVKPFTKPTTPSTEQSAASEKTKKQPIAFLQNDMDKEKVLFTDKEITKSAPQESGLITKQDDTEITYVKSTIAPLTLETGDYQIEEGSSLIKNKNLHYYKRNRFQVGLLSSAIFTPSFNDKIIGTSGATVGATFSYRLNARWSAQTDLLYEFHGRNYAFPNGNNSLAYEYQSYGFGLNDNRLNVKVKQSHMITLPIYLKYHMERHSFDFGLQIAYTLGLRGKIEEETISSNATASTREEKNSWINSKDVSPYQYNMMLGYQFALTKRLSIGLRTVIVPSRLPRHGNDDENAFNPLEAFGLVGNPENVDRTKKPIPIFEHNAINFHFNLQYNLNRKVRHITKPLMDL